MNPAPIKFLKSFESSFYPAENKAFLGEDQKVITQHFSAPKKIVYYASNLFKGAICLIALPISAPVSIGINLANRVLSVFNTASKVTEKDGLDESVISDNYALPNDRGFADSFFQSCGLGSKYSKPEFEGKSNWDDWLTDKHIEVKKDQKFDDFFINYLDDPTGLINILKKMEATSYRFSLERSVIEPKKGIYDLNAIKKYIDFCKTLKQNDIEPWITLEHFVEPKWFSESGGFENEENIDDFVKYSEFIIDNFKNHVSNFMTFNEPAAFIFQTYFRDVFPKEKGRGNKFIRAAKTLRNIFITHIKVYKIIKEKNPKLQIGIVHQFLKFLPFNEYNPIERLTCYYLSMITNDVAYNFFKTKKFAFQIPFFANETFEAKKDEKITDFIGFQCYGYPLVKLGFNGGKTYPGYAVKNYSLPRLKLGLTFGSVPRENSKSMSFGMRFHPEALEDSLNDATALKIPIAITETGCDAKIQKWGEKTFKIDNETQKEFYEKVFKIIQKFRKKLPLKGLFFWTVLRGHLEWDRADNPTLGLVDIEKDPSNHSIKSFVLSPAAEYISKVFKNATSYSSTIKKKVA